MYALIIFNPEALSKTAYIIKSVEQVRETPIAVNRQAKVRGIAVRLPVDQLRKPAGVCRARETETGTKSETRIYVR